MNYAPLSFKDFARRLLMHQAASQTRPRNLVGALEKACQALDVRLSPLISAQGVDALLKRAFVLGGHEFQCIALVRLQGSVCSTASLSELLASCGAAETDDALVAILGNFLWLLTEFIGEDLGLRKVHELWPDVQFMPSDAS